MTRQKRGTMAAVIVLSAALSLQLLGYAAADQRTPTGVVELFTSQGCSSCPPADAVLGDLVQKGDVVALAYHVDYWDYLGWRDTMALPENTQRQQDYGKVFGARSVYTPQAVINGRTHVNGSKKSAIAGALVKLQEEGEGLLVDLRTSRSGSSIIIEAGPGPARKNVHLVLVFFDDPKPVQIDRGENSGTMITYWNAVTGVQTAGMWHGKAARFEFPESEIAKKGGCAALLQIVDKDGLPGAILGAAIIRSPDPAETK